MKGKFGVFREKVKGFDRQSLVKQLMKRYQWSRRKATRATIRYLMFLFLAALYPCKTIVPTCEIDCVWEQHILNNTSQYIRDCEQLLGRVIHHASETEVWEEPKSQKANLAFAQTQALVEQHFWQGAWEDRQLQAIHNNEIAGNQQTCNPEQSSRAACACPGS